MTNHDGAIKLTAPFIIGALIMVIAVNQMGATFSLARFQDSYLVLTMLVIYPVCEEIIFRGWLHAGLMSKAEMSRSVLTLSLANVLVSLLFAVVHALNSGSLQALLVFFPSLAFGWIFEQRRSLVLSIALHSWYNLLSLCTLPLWWHWS